MSNIVKLRILMVSFLVMILLILVAIFLSVDQPRASEPISSSSASSLESSASATHSAYTIGVFDGKVAVFTGNSSTPTEIYDVYLQNLPLVDQEELARGIPIDDPQMLKIKIEDYIS